MRLGVLAARNIARNKLRTTLTVLGVVIAILLFISLRTVLTAWTAAIDHAAKDRIGTRHKITFIMPLPKKYIEEVRDTPGVKEATWANWFGGKDPKHDREFFATLAVDHHSFLSVYDELVIPQDQREEWLTNRRGALVGDALAGKLGWKTGDRVRLESPIYPGEWEFEINGIYTTKRRSIDRSTFFFHWDYLNEALPPFRQDQLGWIVSRVDDPGRAAAISKEIDAKFEASDEQTLSMSERAMNVSFMGMMSAMLQAVDLVSIVILGIMALLLGNTIAMGVRERTNEYGVLRAIGFMPRHIAGFVVGEAVVIGTLGGGIGLLLAYPMVESAIGRFLEENMGAIFPYFRIAPSTAVAALVLAVVLGALAAALPAYRASRLDVIDSLRRVG